MSGCNSHYRHYKNNKIYILIDKCKIQVQDVWLDAVIYENLEGEKFCRSTAEFNAKFKKEN